MGPGMPPGKRPREPVGAAERHGARLRRALSDPVYRFAWAVIVAGAGVLAALVATGAFDWVTHPAAKPLLFVALVICAETVQLKSPRQHDDSVTSASDLFAFTALLLYGPGEAAAGFIGGVLVTGAMRRLPPVKVTFNAAQYVVALGASAAVLAALSNVPHAAGSPFAASDLPAICLAALPLFAINDVLTATVSSLAMGVPPRVHVRRDLPRMLALDGVLVGFAPVMAVSVHFSAAMLPLLALPFATVLYTTREAERREYAATHDALTGLANRIRFRAAVEQELQRARHTGATVAVLALDVDNFKDFNDTLGHNEADSLLIQVAARLRVAAGPRDLVARLGGDDFALLVVGDVDAAQLAELAARLRSALDDQFAVSGLRVGVSASVGMAWSPEHAADAATLLRRSDVAVQLAKLRHAGIEVYDRASDPYSPERLVLAAQLREAIPRGELVLHYQPKLAVESGEVVGVESLVRWRHPTRGLMPPAEFIELAERTDVIGALTMNVLRMALGQVAAWRRVGVELPVAVNLPGQMLLDRDLPRDIASLLARLGLPATCLMVEITESSLIHDPHRSAQILDVLSAMGTRVAIDDFGTGYSSLAWLKRFPVDEIKVDRSFVTELDANESDAAIVRSTIELGRSLGVSVVAEGVETAAVLERLAAYGCDVVQGFLISRPVPAAQLLTWLRGRTHVSGEHSEVSRPSYEL